MDDVWPADAGAHLVALFFTDLMLTMAEGGVEGTDAALAVRALWHSTQGSASRMSSDLDAETLVHGLGAVAAALADQVVTDRRIAGSSDASVADVWQEVARSFEDAGLGDVSDVDLTEESG